MTGNFNPWLALLLGILIGWVLEWALDVWFYRRDRLQAQRRLEAVEADLRAREAQLSEAQIRADAIEAVLADQDARMAAQSEVGAAASDNPALPEGR